MSISIVSVVLNAAVDLSLTIESVRQQHYRDVELIVVDGGSLDDTAAVLALYADVIDKVVCTEDAGIYHAMNIALDHCSNDYVLFLNAKDTLFDSTALSRMMAASVTTSTSSSAITSTSKAAANISSAPSTMI